eukprot:TRINITY_DN15686_c0_g1_i1.p1 TRINITY_DN15686_c0_g1~~TRINITY_DN15686_c0_g1_i1.p1  ORF type:complete len:183 (+),score=47.14 TRINITY_DN15686_c0_g1_i1:199-747(+)
MQSFQFVVLSLVVVVVSQCPTPPTQAKFLVPKYMGSWYEIARFAGVPFEWGSVCDKAEYTLDTQAGNVVVNNSARFQSPQGYNEIFLGTATSDPNDPAKLMVQFSIQPVPAPLWILSTDYEQYSLAWSCVEVLDLFPVVSSWILSRQWDYGNSTGFQQVLKHASQLGIDTNQYVLTQQQGCW